ncbi:MAG: NAD(P)-binding domain-containing protein [Acidobacteriota bacterium]
MEDKGSGSQYEYLIIGAGPAGLQLGYFLEKAGHNYLILEAGDTAGTFFKSFPRHRTLISINKVFTGYDDKEINLRWDWNSLLSDEGQPLFKDYSHSYFPKAEDLVSYLSDYAVRFKIKVKYGVKIVGVTRDDCFHLIDEKGNEYRGLRLVVAAGFTKPYIPAIEGIELAENYCDVSIEPKDFINQRVLVIGKGNSGFETANNLVEVAASIHLVSPTPVKMAWKTHFVGNLRAINNTILDTYQLKSQNIIIDAKIDKIIRRDGKYLVCFDYTHANGEKEKLLYDRVIVCTGFRFDNSIFDNSCQPELMINDRFPKQTSAWESTNVKDLYFAGTLMQMRDYKKTTSGFIHGFRYNIKALFHILEQRYHDQEWSYRLLDFIPENIAEAIIERVNKCSGIWQQFGFLCDLIIIDEQGKVRYYNDVPSDYVHDGGFGSRRHYYTVTLEYGPDHLYNDPFEIHRIERHDVTNAHLSTGLHPIVRHYSFGKQICEHHVIEDVASEWKEEVHVKPLEEFLQHQLISRAAVS